MSLVIFAVALAVRTVFAIGLGLYRESVNFGELESIGRSINETGIFGNPYKIPTGPTSHGAPFYPYLLSVIFHFFGYGTAAHGVVLLLATFFTAMALALLPQLSIRTGLPAWIGGGAGMLGALLPFRAMTELSWEVPYAVTGWIVVLMVTIGWIRTPTPARSLGCGAAWGALFWIAPQLAPPLALILLTSVRVLDWQTARKAVPLVAVATATVIFPWIWRNYQTFGAWSFVRGSLGIELAAAHFPGANPDYNANCLPADPNKYCVARHPFTSASEAAVVKTMGEADYNRWRTREALGYIAADPGVRALVRLALAEDVGSGDLTTRATVPRTTQATGRVVAREAMVASGLVLLDAIVEEMAALGEAGAGASSIRIAREAEDGAAVAAGATLCTLHGDAWGILTLERTVLNFLGHLGGVATETARVVRAVREAGCATRILDTRKTTPGWRRFEKYAVTCGGGTNHRMGLYDGVLIKDNHIAAVGSLSRAVERVRAQFPNTEIEVEADTLEQVREALELKVDLILLDNMSLEETKRAVAITAGSSTKLESSGGLTLDVAAAYAATGVDYLAVGALTHSAPALDIGLDFVG